MKVCLPCECRFDGEDWRCPNCGQSPKIRRGHLAFAPDLTETSESFDIRSFAYLSKVEEGNFWFESRNRLLVWALKQYFPKANYYIEIGCGTGFVLSGIQREFSGLNLSGSEILSEGLSFAQKRLPDVEFFQMDARLIPFECEFDVIGAFDVLEHIDEDDTVLLQMFQATRQGGGILVTVPQHRFLWSAMDEYAFHKRRYTRDELRQKVEKAGFRIERITSFVTLLLPLMLLSRLRHKSSQEADFGEDAMVEFHISPLLNAALAKISCVEQLMIQLGLSFPFGGSLLCIGRKS
jgi:SAM-dependent methyltransferase